MNFVAYKVFFIVALCSIGCSSEEQSIVKQMRTLQPEITFRLEKFDHRLKGFADGKEHVVWVAIGLGRCSPERRSEIKEFLPQLAELKHLHSLSISTLHISDDELAVFSQLSDIRNLHVFDSGDVTDDGLQHFATMKSLKSLTFRDSNLNGSGLAYLKGFDKLTSLELSGDSFKDLAIPHIVDNFLNLKQFHFNKTSFSKDGYLQLAQLIWIENISYPEHLVVIEHDKLRGDERTRQIKKERFAKLTLMHEFNLAHLDSKRKARATGLNAPEDYRLPYGLVQSQLNSLFYDSLERKSKFSQPVANQVRIVEKSLVDLFGQEKVIGVFEKVDQIIEEPKNGTDYTQSKHSIQVILSRDFGIDVDDISIANAKNIHRYNEQKVRLYLSGRHQDLSE